MGFKPNLKEIKSYARSGPVSNRARIQKVIDLYSSRKIPQFRTALSAVLLLAPNHKLTMSKAVNTYDQLMAKYENALPITGILSRAPAGTAKRKRPLLNMKVVFYGSVDEEVEKPVHTKNKTFKGLSQIKAGYFTVESGSPIFSKWFGKLLTTDYGALEKLLQRPPTDAEKKEHIGEFVEMALQLKKQR